MKYYQGMLSFKDGQLRFFDRDSRQQVVLAHEDPIEIKLAGKWIAGKVEFVMDNTHTEVKRYLFLTPDYARNGFCGLTDGMWVRKAIEPLGRKKAMAKYHTRIFTIPQASAAFARKTMFRSLLRTIVATGSTVHMSSDSRLKPEHTKGIKAEAVTFGGLSASKFNLDVSPVPICGDCGKPLKKVRWKTAFVKRAWKTLMRMRLIGKLTKAGSSYRPCRTRIRLSNNYTRKGYKS